MSESASPYSSTSTTAATTNTQRNPTRASMSTTTTSSSSSSRHNNSNNNNQPTPPTTASGGGWRANNIISGNTRPASELLGSHPTTTHPFASPESEFASWFLFSKFHTFPPPGFHIQYPYPPSSIRRRRYSSMNSLVMSVMIRRARGHSTEETRVGLGGRTKRIVSS